MDVAIIWTNRARSSYDKLMGYLGAQPYGNAEARDREIQAAVERLRNAPYRCAVVHVYAGKKFRRLIVKRRFSVYYLYYAPRRPEDKGRISIRAVKHTSRKHPFAGVREPEPLQYGPIEAAG